jgi:hypothetical protein
VIGRALLRWALATAGFVVLEVATRPAVALVERLEEKATPRPAPAEPVEYPGPTIRGPITPGDATVPPGNRRCRSSVTSSGVRRICLCDGCRTAS